MIGSVSRFRVTGNVAVSFLNYVNSIIIPNKAIVLIPLYILTLVNILILLLSTFLLVRS